MESVVSEPRSRLGSGSRDRHTSRSSATLSRSTSGRILSAGPSTWARPRRSPPATAYRSAASRTRPPADTALPVTTEPASSSRPRSRASSTPLSSSGSFRPHRLSTSRGSTTWMPPTPCRLVVSRSTIPSPSTSTPGPEALKGSTAIRSACSVTATAVGLVASQATAPAAPAAMAAAAITAITVFRRGRALSRDWRSAAARAAMSGKRSAGSIAIARMMTSSSGSGTSRRTLPTCGRGAVMLRATTDWALPPANGAVPASIS